MKKLIVCFILSLFIVSAPLNARAEVMLNFNFASLTAMSRLKTSVVEMAKKINVASSQMMKFGDMLVCNAEHGENSYHQLNILMLSVSVHWTDPFTWTSGWILLILGFFIMMLAAFYIFDVAFNLAISLFLLPICLALWPFGWTKEKLKTNIEGITYYVGVFIFLPLGILIAVRIVRKVFEETLLKGLASRDYQISFEDAFDQDKSDLIRDHLGIDSLDFWKIFFCYIVALRVIPLMATEFCTHFFSSSAVGHPMTDKIQQGVNVLKKATLGRAGRYGANVLKSTSGKMIRKMGNENGDWLDRTLYRYGNNMAHRKRK